MGYSEGTLPALSADRRSSCSSVSPKGATNLMPPCLLSVLVVETRQMDVVPQCSRLKLCRQARLGQQSLLLRGCQAVSTALLRASYPATGQVALAALLVLPPASCTEFVRPSARARVCYTFTAEDTASDTTLPPAAPPLPQPARSHTDARIRANTHPPAPVRPRQPPPQACALRAAAADACRSARP
eukprot:scaffold508_cov554-Prasinococcus_capsulatus_cf.AAC.7